MLHAKEAVRLAPQNADYHNRLGFVYCRFGDRESIAAAHEKAIELCLRRSLQTIIVFRCATV